MFFTRSVSLKLWIDSGLFDREKVIYEEHLLQNTFKKIYWFTYGSDDYNLGKKLQNEKKLSSDIEIFQMPKIFCIPKIGSFMYSLVLPFYHWKALNRCHIYKTNQMDGSWSAVISKWLYRKPLMLRTGYTLTQLWKNTSRSKLRIMIYSLIEKFVYKQSDCAVVTSDHNKKYVQTSYNVKFIEVIPNFIDINIFKDFGHHRNDSIIVFVGRLNSEKNLVNLIEAIAHTKFSLDIYGAGPLHKVLESLVIKSGAKVNFKGVISNQDLPEVYNSYKYYILPSLFEGMPKTLLEAMACGCVCIGTNVSGINEVIDPYVNGILIQGTSTEDIISTLNSLNKDETFNGSGLIETHYSLVSIIKQECNLFHQLIGID